MEFKKEDYLGRTAILIYVFFVITSIFLVNFAIDFLSDSIASYIEGAFYISMMSWNLPSILDKRKTLRIKQLDIEVID